MSVKLKISVKVSSGIFRDTLDISVRSGTTRTLPAEKWDSGFSESLIGTKKCEKSTDEYFGGTLDESPPTSSISRFTRWLTGTSTLSERPTLDSSRT